MHAWQSVIANRSIAGRVRLWSMAIAFLALMALVGQALAADYVAATADDFFTPRRHQLDFEIADNALFTDPSSLVRRRQASTVGTALHLGSDLGVDSFQMPTVQAAFWFDELDALQFQFRDFQLYGSSFSSRPVTFNGDVIAPGQDLNTDGTTWFTFGLFYERRLTPWFDRQAVGLPELLQHWDVRPKVGLEFVYLDFQLNNKHPKLISGDLDARGRWTDQELPVPTIGAELRRAIANRLVLEITAQGAWINKWNSGRTEGGTVYLSQSTFETHWRLVYLNRDLIGLKPFLGFSYYYYKQTETSGAIGNLMRLSSFGPEVGVGYSF